MTTTGTGNDDVVVAHLKAAMSSAGAASITDLVPSLPLETRCQPFHLRQLAGFWFPEMILPGVVAAHTHFEPRTDDIFLASFLKSGTTWLKALAFAIYNRAHHPPSDPCHPLRLRSPHDCVSFVELPLELASGGEDVFAALPSPRVLATHLPYNLLPERVTAEEEGAFGCRVVYVCRNPKDALVSGYLFTKKSMVAASGDVVPPAPAPSPEYTMEEAFELFCEGRCVGGPQWLHVLGYWEESRRRPEKVLFLRYEEMLADPASAVRRMAEFMGCPFSDEEVAAGVVEDVVELCSLESLKGSKGNRSGATTASPAMGLRIENGNFFRKGAAGDWRNHLSPEMAARLDGIVAAALEGSGLAFGGGADSA